MSIAVAFNQLNCALSALSSSYHFDRSNRYGKDSKVDRMCVKWSESKEANGLIEKRYALCASENRYIGS